MTSMIRLEDKAKEQLKGIKKALGLKSYQEVVECLLDNYLVEHCAYTQGGYLPVGTVVQDKEGNTLVIKSVMEGKVIFNDLSYVFNKGSACWGLVKVADSVQDHEERVGV